MRVLIFSSNFTPELTGVGRYTGEMARWMLAAGHHVRVVTVPPYYPQWRVWEGYSAIRYVTETEDIQADGGAVSQRLTIVRCPLYVPARPTGMRRVLHVMSFAIAAIGPALASRRWSPDIVLCIEPTLSVAPLGLLVAKTCGAASALHIQDFEVDAALKLRILKLGWLRGVPLVVERALMRRFDLVSSISKRMVERLLLKGVAAHRVALFQNWVDDARVFPLTPDSVMRSRFGLPADKVIALYSGSIGQKQGLESVIEAARILSGRGDILFVIAGAGPGREALEEQAADLVNLRFTDLQPESALNEFLNSADIHLLPQRAEAADLVLPSKLLAMMASGRPVVATAAPGSQLYEHVSGRGLAVPAGDARSLAEAVARLADFPSQRTELGTRAREHAVEAFSKQRVLIEWMRRLEALVSARA